MRVVVQIQPKQTFAEIKKKIMTQLELEARDDIVKEIIAKKISNTGKLMQSVVNDLEDDSILVGVPYAGYVEMGTKPRSKYPPYPVLLRWVQLKLGIKTAKESRRVTWAIMSKIRRKGTKPRNYIKDALDNLISRHR